MQITHVASSLVRFPLIGIMDDLANYRMRRFTAPVGRQAFDPSPDMNLWGHNPRRIGRSRATVRECRKHSVEKLTNEKPHIRTPYVFGTFLPNQRTVLQDETGPIREVTQLRQAHGKDGPCSPRRCLGSSVSALRSPRLERCWTVPSSRRVLLDVGRPVKRRATRLPESKGLLLL